MWCQWGICWNKVKHFKQQCKRKQRKVNKVCARSYLYKNYELSRKKEMSHSDLCDNKLSEFEGDENKRWKNCWNHENNKTMPIWTKTRRGDRESFKEEGI